MLMVNGACAGGLRRLRMAATGGAKICVACGEDCSNRPRTKDAKGRYFCKPCYEKAVQHQRSAAAPAPHSAKEIQPNAASTPAHAVVTVHYQAESSRAA